MGWKEVLQMTFFHALSLPYIIYGGLLATCFPLSPFRRKVDLIFLQMFFA